MDRSLVSRYLPSINTAMYAFVTELAAEGVPDPPARELTFAALRDDLCHLAGEGPPAVVEALLGAPVCCRYLPPHFPRCRRFARRRSSPRPPGR